VFYVCIVWSVGYWVAYPAWPTLSGYTQGMLGYSQRDTVSRNITDARAAQSASNRAIAASTVEQIKADPNLLQFAMAGGRVAFGDNCAACHGRGAQGASGYPNLNDDEWVWGGTLEAIHQTIRHGIRSTDGETRVSAMPRFGIDGMLDRAQISELADFVLSLSGGQADAEAVERGRTLFADNCAACHGDDGKGNQELGAPNLSDAIWLYGSAKDDIVRSIETGRGGVMPGWTGRLDDNMIKKLTVYVHSLGGGQ
jgi:cytochrome c oxidase cbb3-type subunit 3